MKTPIGGYAGVLFVFLWGPAVQAQQDSNFVANIFSPGTMAKFSLGVLYDQATSQTPAWGSGGSGLEKRAEWRMAAMLGRASAEFGVARTRQTNTFYVRCRCKGFVPRSRHVLVSEFTEVRGDGSLAPPMARMAGIAASAAITTVAERASAGSAGQRALLLMNTDIGFNMLTEFWPEIKRTLLLRKR